MLMTGCMGMLEQFYSFIPTSFASDVTALQSRGSKLFQFGAISAQFYIKWLEMYTKCHD